MDDMSDNDAVDDKADNDGWRMVWLISSCAVSIPPWDHGISATLDLVPDLE